MAGWMMTRLTSMSNMGWLYNCIIWFYSFYWLWPSSLILPSLHHELMHVHSTQGGTYGRADAYMPSMAIRSCAWGGRYGNLEITRLCCMYGACSSVEECSLLWLRSVCFLRFLRCEGSICRRPYHQDRHLLRCRPWR